MPYQEHRRYIDACMQCATVCNHCAAECLKEEDAGGMARCAQMAMECAILCYTASQLLSLNSSYASMVCSICADACDGCAAECGQHTMQHCIECAAACRRCAAECRSMHN